MDLLNFVALMLAADAINTAWFFGSLFDKQRVYFKGIGGFFGELLTCQICLAYHISFWTAVILWVPGLFFQEPISSITRLPLYAFAITDVVHLMQLVHPFWYKDEINVSITDKDIQVALESDTSTQARSEDS
jgi:hypothetical protein